MLMNIFQEVSQEEICKYPFPEQCHIPRPFSVILLFNFSITAFAFLSLSLSSCKIMLIIISIDVKSHYNYNIFSHRRKKE
jgi:hypothetical protein